MNSIKTFRLDGRAALVTGSSRGIGRAIALGLAECGAVVAVHGSKPAKALDETLAEVRKLSPRSVAVTGDLSQSEVPARIVAEATAALGALDILVVNASIQIRKPWAEVTQAAAEQQMQVNFHATLRMIQAAVPAMRAKKWGRILTVGSVQQQRPHPDMVVYAASKSAQENLVRNLAKQVGPDGITINNLAPGVILTDRNVPALSDDAYAARVREIIPLRFFGESEDCVGAALLLCSDAGRYITGVDLLVDGGMALP
ncbi:MAG: short-chain dehydrogenase [Verrucomicrobia bacterium GWF2_62_7]|nr:MAG: short-chain dehydrogenase [Verrucomicrobia bacterium GWF2_62_7]